MKLDEAKLIDLRARAQALEETIKGFDQQLERGILEPARHAALITDYRRQRIAILMTLKKTVGGTDARIDEVLDSEIDGTGDKAEAAKQLRKVAEEKGLGTKILEAIDKNRGTIITWAIDIALAIGRRVA